MALNSPKTINKYASLRVEEYPIKIIGLNYEFKMRRLYVQILFEFYLMNIPLLVKKDQYFFF